MSFDNPITQKIDARNLQIAIVASRYNGMLVDSLLRHAMANLALADAPAPTTERVPGAAELPYAANALADHKRFDAIIALGVVIAGDTDHHTIIGDSTARALQEISIRQKVPVINGILVVNTIDQAQARIDGTINRGKEFALAALEMAQFKKKWKTKNQ
ncbi:MAG: 6,7-dimethyl-8-ribityllumazine synthase [Zhongshania aliphaticivorans]|jgi:6,7-dimethyl-8-ribityllumazine synthase